MKHQSDVMKDIYNFHSDRKYHHPVGIIDFDYNMIDPNAVNNNLLYVQNQKLFDTPGRSQSPYQTKKASLATILLTEEWNPMPDGTHYLHFDQNFVYQNTGFNLSNVTYLKITVNGTVVTDGARAGINNLTIPIFLNAQTRVAEVGITVGIGGQTKYWPINPEQIEEEDFTNCNGVFNINVQGAPQDFGYGVGAKVGYGRGNIYFANNNCQDLKVRKPIIFVDGFDPGNKQKAPQVWKEYLNKDYSEGQVQKKLGDDLRAAGYDVIIYDEMPTPDEEYDTGGTGFIETNALTLEVFLQQLHASYASTIEQDFVVVGASMGGLITRYALADMEQKGLNHHTRLFVSFDAPQNGAHIPIGLQQLVDVFTVHGTLGALSKSIGHALHNSAAAKQMLLHHSSQESLTPVVHPWRTKFLQNLAAVGNWPTQCRMVAMVDGNLTGTKKSTSIPITIDNEGVPTITACQNEFDLRILQFFNPFFLVTCQFAIS